MKKLFYLGLALLALFEGLRVYLIMPFPGSQRFNTLDAAYFLHTNRWIIRILLGIVILLGARAASAAGRRWVPALAVALVAGLAGMTNLKMQADVIFKEPDRLSFSARSESTLDERTVIVGVAQNGQAKAYPIRYLVYHHQIQDTVGGRPVLITYCSVCRTGRVFDPIVAGHHERFRLVGMDHFNAMLEDRTTGSWWRQATGKAVTGSRRGEALGEIDFLQVTLKKWFELHPSALVMEPDQAFADRYDPNGEYERGESTKQLTGTNHASWEAKSWVIGVEVGPATRAYDWNDLMALKLINDTLGGSPIVIAVAQDGQSFAAFERGGPVAFEIHDDVLVADGRSYDLGGNDLTDPSRRLAPVKASQEFWHSWQSFHPSTARYQRPRE